MSRAPQNQPGGCCPKCGGVIHVGPCDVKPDPVAPAREHHMSDHADTVREFVETAVRPLGPWQESVLAALDALVAERDEARRENTELRKVHAQRIASSRAAWMAAEADRDRYAAALDDIEEYAEVGSGFNDGLKHVRDLARVALKDEA